MAFNDLLNQTITLYPKASIDAYGRRQVGTGVSHPARVQETTAAKLLPNGETINIDAVVYLKSSVSVEHGDKITYDGNDYKVFSRNTSVDGAGTTHHIKLEITKWQE